MTTPGAPLLYYGDEYGEYGGADPDNRHMYRDSANWNDRESALYENISALGQLRANSIAIKQGTYSTRYASPDLLIYDMSHFEQNMSIILNRGPATTYDGFDTDDIVRFGDTFISSSTTSIPANSVSIIELDAVIQPPPRDQDSHCLIVNNFTINTTYFITLDLTNTCDTGIHYPGVNSSVDNTLVEGFPGYTEWFYLIGPNSSYNMTWQLSVNETIPNGTEVTLTFNASILSCSDDDNSSQWHYCPTSSLTHTFLVNHPSNSNDPSDDVTAVLGCTDSSATNFDSDATEDDGSCEYPPEIVLGCTDSLALNFAANANQDDGTCQYETDLPDNNSTDNQTDDSTQNNTDNVDNGEHNNTDDSVDNSGQTNDTNTGNDSQIVTDAEEKSSLADFARNGLAVAVFCGLVILFFTTMRKK